MPCVHQSFVIKSACIGLFEKRKKIIFCPIYSCTFKLLQALRSTALTDGKKKISTLKLAWVPSRVGLQRRRLGSTTVLTIQDKTLRGTNTEFDVHILNN